MSRKLVIGVFVLGVFALVAAGLIPGLHNATTNDVTQTVVLDEGQAQTLDDDILVNATNVSLNGSNATVRVTDLESQERNSTTLNVSETGSVSVGGENVTVTLDSVRSASKAVVSTRYAALYGWPDGPRFVMENIGVMVVMVGVSMIIGLVAVARNA